MSYDFSHDLWRGELGTMVGWWRQWSTTGLFLDCTASCTWSYWSISLLVQLDWTVSNVHPMDACTPRPHLRLIDWPKAFKVYWQLCLSEYDCQRVQNSFIWKCQLCALIRTSLYLPKMRKFMKHTDYSRYRCAWNQSCSNNFHDNDLSNSLSPPLNIPRNDSQKAPLGAKYI